MSDLTRSMHVPVPGPVGIEKAALVAMVSRAESDDCFQNCIKSPGRLAGRRGVVVVVAVTGRTVSPLMQVPIRSGQGP